MLVSLLLALSATPHVIDLDERAPLLLIRMTPKDARVPIPSERLFRTADQSLRAHSRLVLRSPEQVGIDTSRLLDCELDRRLSCWVGEARTARPSEGPAFLLVLSMVAAEGGTVDLTALLLDLPRSMAILADPKEEEPTETRIFALVVTARSEGVRLDDEAALAAAFDRLFQNDFAAAFRARSLADPVGAIRIDVGRPDLAIELDGAAVGTTGDEPTTLQALAPGARRILLRDPESGEALHERTIVVRSNEAASIALSLAAPDRTLANVGLYGGIALASVGVVIVAVAAALRRAEVITPCIGAECIESSSMRFAGTCDAGADRPSSCASGGLLLAPFGFSLTAAGGLWSLGAVLFGEEELGFWLSLAAGVALGGAIYGISAVAGG